MRGAVVIGGHVQGLGIIRMLGWEGIPVLLMDTTCHNVARFSKYCTMFIKIPGGVFESEEKFCRFLKEKSQQYDLHEWILFPTDDRTVAYLSRNKKELSDYFQIWTPSWDTVEQCYNKKLTYDLAKKIDIPMPESHLPENLSDVRAIGNRLQYPVIIKPAVMHTFYAHTRKKVIIIRTKEELEEQYLRVRKIIPPSEIIIQEIIPGPPENLYSFGSFFKDGNVIASVMGRRSRQIPMDFGKASTYVELVEIPEIGSLASRLLKALGYYGLSEVEFKYDARDGKFKLLEINPRTWKWHSIASLHGVNLPYLLYCDMNEIICPITSGEFLKMNNGKWIDEYTDLFISLKEMLLGNMTPSKYISTLMGKKVYGSFSYDDPLPFLAETMMIPVLFRR